MNKQTNISFSLNSSADHKASVFINALELKGYYQVAQRTESRGFEVILEKGSGYAVVSTLAPEPYLCLHKDDADLGRAYRFKDLYMTDSRLMVRHPRSPIPAPSTR